jgi:glycine/D-amino acid oxidase-like deaminating enzyme
MKSKNFWAEGYKKPKFKKLSEDISTDFLVVGGGISGVFAAYKLSKYGKVVLIEGETIGSGATGKSAGYLTLEPDLISFKELVKEVGESGAREYWSDLKHSQLEILEIIKSNNINCDQILTDTLYVNTTRESAKFASKDALLRNKNKFYSEILVNRGKVEELNLANIINIEKVDKSLCLNPYKFICEFAKLISEKGVFVYENSPMIKIEKNKCITKNAEITFKKTLVCIDSFGMANIDKYMTTIAITNKLSKENLESMKLDDNDATLWNTKNKSFFYTRNTLDNRILIGYGDTKVKTAKTKVVLHKLHLKMIQKFIKKEFGEFGRIIIDYAWSGIFGQSKKSIPEIKKVGDVVYFSGGATQLVSISFINKVVNEISQI